MGLFYQLIFSGIACYLCISSGLTFTWPSCVFKLFASNTTTLNRPMTEAEISLFGSLSSIGGLISTPVAGFFLDRIGRKYCLILPALIQVFSWSLIAAFAQVEVILAAVFLTGVGGASFLVVPLFVTEICQESVRGAMASVTMIFYGFGMLLSYLLGGCLPYHTMIYVGMSMSVLGVALLSLLRETPTYLMHKGREMDATKSMAFYRNVKMNSKVLMEEMDKLRRAFNPHLDGGSSPEEETLKVDAKPKAHEKLSLWKFIKKSRSTRKAMVVTLTLMTAAIFQGLVVVQVYAEPLFAEAVPNWSSTICSVVLAAVSIVAGLATSYLVEVAGRRPLMVYSSLCSCACCLALGSQLQYLWAPHWVTAVLLYGFTAAYTAGPGNVPFVLVAEVFLPEVKSFMSTFVIEWAWLCNFIILVIFNPLVNVIGLGPVFYIFAAICLVTAVFCLKFQPETKGLPVDAIQALFC